MKHIPYKIIVFIICLLTMIVPSVNAQQTAITVATIRIYAEGELLPVNIKAIPEKRVYQEGGNYSTNLKVQLKNTSTGELLKESIGESNNAGYYNSVSLDGMSPGTYHAYAKGESHLTDKEASVALDEQTSMIDFSNGETDTLLAGDVNGVDFGDDIVNAIDLSVLITDIDGFDVRTDLNKDGIVNALDLSIMITNIDETGDV